MPLSIQALWILCALGAAVFAAGGLKWRVVTGLLIGFAAAVTLFRGGVLPDSGWVGGLVAVVAGLQLFRPRWAWTGPVCGGFLAGILSGLMQFHELPLGFALPLAAVLPVLSAWLARRPSFAPPAMREEALLLMLVLGLGSALVPAIVEGWRSAGALNSAVREGVKSSIPAWTLALSGISIMLGGAWSLWRHR